METAAPAPVVQRPPATGRIVAAIVLGLVALGLIAAGGAGLYARTATSDHGWITTGSHRYAAGGRAIVSGSLDVGQMPDWLVAKARVTASSATGRAIFVGVGSRRDVDRYLAGVAHSTLEDVNFGPFAPTYAYAGGRVVPARPAAQRFWVEASVGREPRAVSWKLRSGHWRVVVMNADGSPNVAVTAKVGAYVRGALAIALSLLGAGLLFAGGAIALVARRR